jgi:DNA-binding MurR/RpiR family transcriptional regulator
MGKKKPLTAEQEFIMSKLPKYDRTISRPELKPDKETGFRRWVAKERTPTEARRLLKYRQEGWNEWKYEKARTAIETLMEVLKNEDVENFESVVWELRRAMKYQGYLQLRVAYAEWLYEQKLPKKEQDERKAKRKLKKKVQAMNEKQRRARWH